MADQENLHAIAPKREESLSVSCREQRELAKLDAEIEKINAERHKLDVEAHNISNKWRTFAKTLVGLSPAFVAFAGLVLLQQSRWFEVQSDKLKLEGKYLNETNAVLQGQRRELSNEVVELERARKE